MFRGRSCDWRRRGLRALGCACVVSAAVAGDAREAMPKDPAPLPSTSRTSAWEPSLTARLAGGFKDNAALSQVSPESSGFFRSSLDAAAVRLPVEGTQTTLLLLGEDTRYWSSRTVDHEDFVFGQAEVRRFWLNDWQAALSFESAYVDQVIDLSVTETNQTRLAVRGGTMVGRPSVRRELSADWWLGLETPVTRQMFHGLPDDYWMWTPRMTLGRTYGNGSELTAAYEFGFRHYDTDPARRVDRTAVTNETRITVQHELQGVWKHYWDAQRRWRTLTKVTYRMSADQRGGYFDYWRAMWSEQVRYKQGPWSLTAEARLARYHFPNQKGSNRRDDRVRTDLGLVVRAERNVGRNWTVFGEYEHAATDSSLVLEEYTANTVLGGVEVEF